MFLEAAVHKCFTRKMLQKFLKNYENTGSSLSKFSDLRSELLLKRFPKNLTICFLQKIFQEHLWTGASIFVILEKSGFKVNLDFLLIHICSHGSNDATVSLAFICVT